MNRHAYRYAYGHVYSVHRYVCLDMCRHSDMFPRTAPSGVAAKMPTGTQPDGADRMGPQT